MWIFTFTSLIRLQDMLLQHREKFWLPSLLSYIFCFVHRSFNDQAIRLSVLLFFLLSLFHPLSAFLLLLRIRTVPSSISGLILKQWICWTHVTDPWYFFRSEVLGCDAILCCGRITFQRSILNYTPKMEAAFPSESLVILPHHFTV